MMATVYLGEGVYAETDDFGRLVLTTGDGTRVTSMIALDRDALVALDAYLAQHFAWLRHA